MHLGTKRGEATFFALLAENGENFEIFAMEKNRKQIFAFI